MVNVLLTPKDLAAECKVPLATIYAMNTRGNGPRRHKVGKHVRYRRADVDAWLEGLVVTVHGRQR